MGRASQADRRLASVISRRSPAKAAASTGPSASETSIETETRSPGGRMRKA